MGSVVSESVADWEDPFRVAVMVADWSESKRAGAGGEGGRSGVGGYAHGGGNGEDGRGAVGERHDVALVVDFERVTVQVVLALEARPPAAH